MSSDPIMSSSSFQSSEPSDYLQPSSPVITSVINILDGVNWADIDSDNEDTIWELLESKQKATTLAKENVDNNNKMASIESRVILNNLKNVTKNSDNNNENNNEVKRPRKRVASDSSSSSSTCGSTTSDIRKCLKKRKKSIEYEEDKQVLSRRSKQIDYGKNTLGYQNYLKVIPKEKRMVNDPQTPNKFIKFSRRSWDQQIKLWRKKLHVYDPPEENSEKGDEEEIDKIEMDLDDINAIIYLQ